jgi:Domain of unknown function (DUF4262)
MYVRAGSDELERKVIAAVQDGGWYCMHVTEEGMQPPFSFSIGFYKTWRFPELIAIGLDHEVTAAAFNIIGDQLTAGRPIDLNSTNEDLFEGYACRFIEVSKAHYREYVGTALWYYEGSKFPLYQIVWPSKEGLYPWHPQASEDFRFRQPVLGQAV